MREVTGDLFEVETDALAITTNGSIRRDGAAVMGRGVALTAKTKWPGIELVLGMHLKKFGNHVHRLSDTEMKIWGHRVPRHVYSLPVKHDWREMADVELIRRSLHELKVAFTGTIALVRPGCGNGGLTWEVVRPIVQDILPDDRFVVVEWR